MNMETQFRDLGIDAVVGSQIMEALGIDPMELRIPKRFEKLREIIESLKDREDRLFLIRKITTGKNVDKLDLIWEYLQLESHKDKLRQEKLAIESGIEKIKENGDDQNLENRNILLVNKIKELDRLSDQLKEYE